MKPFFFFLLRKLLYLPIRFFLIKQLTNFHNIPKKGAAILAFNHQSFFDFICFVAVAPRNIYYLTAEKFYSHPFWKPIMTMADQIKVERTSKDKDTVHAKVYDHLHKGHLVGIFPEGTRSRHKGAMMPGYTGVAKYALDTGIPVIPVGICGTEELWDRSKKLPTIEKDVRFHVGEPIRPEDFKDVENPHHEKTKAIVEKLAALSGRMCGGVYEKPS